MRGFLREFIRCTWSIGIGLVSLGDTLKEIQSLKKDKSWVKPRRLNREDLKVTLKMTKRESLIHKGTTCYSENTLEGMITLQEETMSSREHMITKTNENSEGKNRIKSY
jgi:hypothetical protein